MKNFSVELVTQIGLLRTVHVCATDRGGNHHQSLEKRKMGIPLLFSVSSWLSFV